MPKLLRKKLAWMTLFIYWPTLFILAHLPLPRVVHEAHLSDKSLHFLAYFILVVLLWCVVKPYDRVHWRKPTVWIILAVIIWYGVVDEWLQGMVRGRTADVRDFFSDLAGALAGLLLLSVLPFRPAVLLTAALTIFITTGCTQTELIERWPIARFAFYFLAYAGLTLVWLWCSSPARCRAGDKPDTAPSAQPRLQPRLSDRRWLFLGMALPVVLLICVKIGTLILDRRFAAQDMGVSAIGIACTVGAFLATRNHYRPGQAPRCTREKS